MRIRDWSSDVCSSDLDDRGDAEMGRADAEIEIADRRRLGRDDVNVDGELVGMEAERLLDALQAVERVEGGERMQDHAAHRVDRKIGRASCRERVCQYV